MKTTAIAGRFIRNIFQVTARTLVVAGFLFALLLAPDRATAQGIPVTQYPLNSWSFFDTNDWTVDYGYDPVSFTNLKASLYGDWTALVVDSTNVAWLQYNVVEYDGTTNLAVNQGSVTLWFAPSWGSTNAGGSGPGAWGQLIDVGQWTTNASYGWWSLYTDPAGANLYFSVQNDGGTQANYLSAPIAWTPNQWHFIALTYSSTQTALYLDGQLATNGTGMSVWPNAGVLANGFYIGSDTNGQEQAHGTFDDIYTYNFVLNSNTISSTFSFFKPAYYLLDSWSFNDTNAWRSDYGFTPVSFTNLNFSYFGNGTALVVDSTNAAWLHYNAVENNGRTNLMVNQGSITMWFSPDWSSTSAGGNGPGGWGQLINVGQWTSDASYGWWSLFTDPAGTNVYFSAQNNTGTQSNYLAAPISWNTSGWHFIALSYSATNTALYLDGKLATNGTGMSIYPNSQVLSNGFYIGSDTNGAAQAHGMFDDIYTYSIPLDANTVSNLFINERTPYMISPWNTFNESLVSALSSPSTAPVVPDVITGSGNLTWVGAATPVYGTNAYNIWITNVTATAGSGGTENITFTIQGGQAGYYYDVFANPLLSFGTNGNPWAWMGQGTNSGIYTLNIPSPNAYLILGTPLDSDGNGLTDAYELLVSKTNPLVDDQNGAGIPDGWQVLLGLNPLVNQFAQPTTRSNYGYTTADWLNGVSGIRSGSITNDPEGNVLSVSQ